MVGVAEKDVGTECFQILKRNALHGTCRGHRHEHGSLNVTVSRFHCSASAACRGFPKLKHVLIMRVNRFFPNSAYKNQIDRYDKDYKYISLSAIISPLSHFSL